MILVIFIKIKNYIKNLVSKNEKEEKKDIETMNRKISQFFPNLNFKMTQDQLKLLLKEKKELKMKGLAKISEYFDTIAHNIPFERKKIIIYFIT